jgi:hypothetical protein
MRAIDAGHEYELESYDGTQPNRLVFMKREGEGYPFNVGHHAGTNCQEVLRALIDRVKYLQKQIPCDENLGLLTHLRGALFCLEYRAARRHGRVLHIPSESALEVEDYAVHRLCGHIQCDGNCKAKAREQPVASRPAAECVCCEHSGKLKNGICQHVTNTYRVTEAQLATLHEDFRDEAGVIRCGCKCEFSVPGSCRPRPAHPRSMRHRRSLSCVTRAVG